ncbi:MAG TPA: hypothetical protein VFR81_05195 [Longimicrobium sp.]|nr:hypothetical protein [Longimicrobium sp.]
MKACDEVRVREGAIKGRAGRRARIAPWEAFLHSVEDSLRLRPNLRPMPEWEDHGDATVRAMQRARRQTWLHARYALGWSMFESIRIAVRLSEAFIGWTRRGERGLDELAAELEEVAKVARGSSSARGELGFVHQLLAVAESTELHLVEMDFALEALRRSEAGERMARAG